MTQGEILIIIASNPEGIMQEVITAKLGVHASTVSKQCRKLERYGKVTYKMGEYNHKVWFLA